MTAHLYVRVGGGLALARHAAEEVPAAAHLLPQPLDERLLPDERLGELHLLHLERHLHGPRVRHAEALELLQRHVGHAQPVVLHQALEERVRLGGEVPLEVARDEAEAVDLELVLFLLVDRGSADLVVVNGDVEVGLLLQEDEGAGLVAAEDGAGERRVAPGVGGLDVGALLEEEEAADGGAAEGGVVQRRGEELVAGVDALAAAHGLDEHAAHLDGVGARAVGVTPDLDEAVVQRQAAPHVQRERVGAVPQQGDLQVEALGALSGGAVVLARTITKKYEIQK